MLNILQIELWNIVEDKALINEVKLISCLKDKSFKEFFILIIKSLEEFKENKIFSIENLIKFEANFPRVLFQIK
jgi:hypothetical protein